MPIQTSTKIEGNVLILTARGTFDSLDDLGKNTQSTIETLVSSGCTRLLGDYRELDGDLDTVDLFHLASADASSRIPADRVAIVLKVDNQNDNRFYENVAYNRGLKVRIFYDCEEARAWVNE